MLNLFKKSDNKIETSPDGHWIRITYQITQDPVLASMSDEPQPVSLTITYDNRWREAGYKFTFKDDHEIIVPYY